jgi:type III restriction enzyme
MVVNAHDTKIKENPINENWKDFKELWERINKRYAYIVQFKSGELIKKSITEIDKQLRVAELSYTLTKGSQEIGRAHV